MNNIKISIKLITLVILTSSIIVLIGLYGVSNLARVNKGVVSMYNDRIVPLQRLKTVSDCFAVDIVDVSHKIRSGQTSWRKGASAIQGAMRTISTEWTAFMGTEMSPDEKRMADDTELKMKEIKDVISELEEILDMEDTVKLEAFINEKLYQNITPFSAKITFLTELKLTEADKIMKESDKVYVTAEQNSYILIIVGVLLAIILSVIIITGINSGLKQANKALSKLSQGFLDIKIQDMGRDEIGVMMKNLRLMIDKLKETISFVRDSADNIASASQQLSQGSSEQASSTEEVSSSMEQMSANIQQNTDNAQQTERIAVKATSDIEEGSSNVNETVDSMKLIADKISIIGEIARKTDLLAINAAVEAARANENGRGFAVVASEIRKLAENTQKAAKEIDEVSKSSVRVAELSGKLLADIVPDIQNTSRLVQEISAASIEQNSGTNQINSAIQQLNQVTQQNAAASEELSSQADKMLEIIDFFQFKSYTRKRKVNAPRLSNVISKTTQPEAGIDFNMNDSVDDNGFERF